MKLWILRHGEAEPRKTTDAERALTPHGRKEAQGAGRSLVKYVGSSLTILVSPYLRAQQTAQLVLSELKAATHDKSASRGLRADEIALITVDWCTPEDDPQVALDHLAFREEAEILLVSHMPLVSALTSLLVDGDMRAGPPLHTASLVELEMPIIGAGMAQLLSLRHPLEFKKSPL
jgi:phosphohistidine phosphatase